MPVLKNARHERFAQALAKGSTIDAAYQSAGFAANRGNATRLNANESVAARTAELKDRAAERTVVTVAGLTERLLRIAAVAEASKAAPMLSVARASIMDVAKLNGLVIDKTQRELSEDQLKAVLDIVATQPGAAEQLLARLA